MNVYIMYHPKFHTPFVKSIFQVAAPDLVLWIYPVSRSLRKTFPVRNMRLRSFLKSPMALEKQIYFTFDYFLTPALMAIELLKARAPQSEVIYIQHGLIKSILGVSRKTNYAKYINALPTVSSFIFDPKIGKNILQRIHYIKKLWRRDFNSLETKKIFSKSYFFIEEDLIWARTHLNISENYFLYQSAASKKIFYKKDGAKAYISQPLVEDKIITRHQYKKLLAFVWMSERPDLVLVHPRDSTTPAILAELGESAAVTSLSQESQIEVQSVIGHFSTLLKELPHANRVFVDIHQRTIRRIQRQKFEALQDLGDILR